MKLKLSQKMIGYLALLALTGVVSLCAEGTVRLLSLAALLLIAGAAGLYMRNLVSRLERAAEKLPDLQGFEQEMQGSHSTVVKAMVEGVRRVDERTKEKYSAKAMDRQSRLNALQSQINPHFLYNTLECIRSEAMLSRQESIANMAKSLAAFFRYSISRKENIVTILDEIGNIKNYFLIQNYRFENKFRLELTVEEERAYGFLIPKMTLQPIVENAVFHGLETKQGDCLVKIVIALTEDKLILTVSDNGIGMEPQTLEKLRAGMEEEQREGSALQSAHGNGIALYNVNRRIKLAFGADYGLQIYSTPGVGTDIEIIMPIVKKLQEDETRG